MATGVNRLPPAQGCMHILLAYVPSAESAPCLQRLYRQLPAAHAERINTFKQSHDRVLRLAAVHALCTGLRTCTGLSTMASLAALRYAASGCPSLALEHWHLSFAYTHTMAVCALRFMQTQAPIVGVDVENIPITGPLESFTKVFTPEERRAIAACADSPSDLTRRWTIKEAVLKALGTGFAVDPLRITTIGARWGQSFVCGFSAQSAGQQPLYTCAVSSTQSMFWQSIPLTPASWLTLASDIPWKESRISCLRLA
ncbi:MAG: 4'-phosphopantetheinyl transferase superfamily protein [Desulfovibrionaceae bacterium]